MPFDRSFSDTEPDGLMPDHPSVPGSSPSVPGGLPSLTKQATNFAAAVGRMAAAWLKGGRVLADEETRASRVAICETCEYRRGKRCGLCGCALFRRILSKPALETERGRCPKNKW